MLDISFWAEIFSTIRKNKLRTFLTGFSVAWGIFILVILLGSGRGLENAILHNFSDATNSVWMWGGQTSMPYDGMKPGRYINIKNTDFENLKSTNDEVQDLSASFRWGGNTLVSYKNEYGDFHIAAAHPAHQKIEGIRPIKGRLLNENDQKEARKVTVIGKLVSEAFFPNEDPIGKYVNIKNVPFKVVGVFEDTWEGEMKRLYMPMSTGRKVFNRGEDLGMITFTVGDASIAESEKMVDDVRKHFANAQKFNVDDRKAMGFWNARKEMGKFFNLFKGIEIFIWVVGILTIIAGTVGVMNIMLISVKERTKEIGIRKALGAKPMAIIKQIMVEAVVIMSLFGYLGMAFGLLIVSAVEKNVPPNEFFRSPEVDLQTALGALVLLVLAGSLAGFMPAKRAATIKPIVALRDE